MHETRLTFLFLSQSRYKSFVSSIMLVVEICIFRRRGISNWFGDEENLINFLTYTAIELLHSINSFVSLMKITSREICETLLKKLAENFEYHKNYS